jgi:hypothetical protein
MNEKEKEKDMYPVYETLCLLMPSALLLFPESCLASTFYKQRCCKCTRSRDQYFNIEELILTDMNGR